MSVNIFMLLFFFCVVKIEGSYPPIKFIMWSKIPRLLLSNDIKPIENQELYCLCPQNDNNIDDTAHHCTGTENDDCIKNYVPRMVERIKKCGPYDVGDLKFFFYKFKLESDKENIFYTINLFQICVNENEETPENAYAAYDILPSSLSSSTSFHSHSGAISKPIEEMYEKKTNDYKKDLKDTEEILDILVPQTLIPSNSIPNWFSNGATDTIYNLMPQWKSKFSKWDHINRIIEQKAGNNDFTVITGASDKQIFDSDNIHMRYIISRAYNHLMIPHYWWTIIRNEHQKKAIVFVMNNEPDQKSSDRELCPPIDIKNTIWKDIKENESDQYIYACILTKELFQNLINTELEYDFELFEKEIPFIGERKILRSLRLLYSNDVLLDTNTKVNESEKEKGDKEESGNEEKQ